MINSIYSGEGWTVFQKKINKEFLQPDWIDNEDVTLQHRRVKEFALEHGVKIYNVVPDGFESPIYEKVTWDYVKQHVLA